MPASIAHMVIAHNALTLLKDKGFKELADFAALLDDPAKDSLCQAYMNLGSIGPDLYYYANMAQVRQGDAAGRVCRCGGRDAVVLSPPFAEAQPIPAAPE